MTVKVPSEQGLSAFGHFIVKNPWRICPQLVQGVCKQINMQGYFLPTHRYYFKFCCSMIVSKRERGMELGTCQQEEKL